MARVEIGKTPVAAKVITVLHDDTLHAQGVVVDRLRPGVGRVEVEAARKAFVERRPKRVVTRIAGALSLSNVAELHSRKDRAGHRERDVRSGPVYRLVDVPPKGQVRALRPEVANRSREIRRQLALHVQIPRLHVGVPKVVVYRLRRKSGGTSQIDGVIETD